VWQWIGFARKDNAKKTLGKHFAEPEDYKIIIIQLDENIITNKLYEEKAAPPVGGAKILHIETYEDQNKEITNKLYEEKAAYPVGEAAFNKKNLGGQNREQILMTIKTFKKLCLKANTKKSNEIHDYYLNLEEIVQESIDENNNELRLQIEKKDQLLIEKDQLLIKERKVSELEKQILLEKTLLEQFPENVEAIYLGIINNKDSKGDDLLKYGNSNNLSERIIAHKKTYDNFRLVAAFKVKNKIQIENAIKKHNILKKRKRIITIQKKTYVELLALNNTNFTLEKIIKHITQIIIDNEYNIENFRRLTENCQEMEIDNKKLIEENQNLISKNESLEKELIKYNPVVLNEEKNNKYYKITSRNYYLYAFHCKESRYICDVTKATNIQEMEKMLQGTYKTGYMKYKILIQCSFMEKIMNFMLKGHALCLGNNIFEGDFDKIKLTIDIIVKLENLLFSNQKTLENLDNIFTNPDKKIERLDNTFGQLDIDPECASINKARRPVDQVNKDTNELVATYTSLEECGKALNCTGTNVGICLRNNKLCKGYIVRYAGISHEDQFKDQPVVKINCKNNEKTHFKNLVTSGKDAGITSVAMRNRINANIHVGNCHWVWDEGATHYKNK
jgi:hypothetical protein